MQRREDSHGFRLKHGIKIHLFITTAPCGDARIFTFNDEKLGYDPHPNRSSRGLLRAKIEDGEGGILVRKETSNLTWDGVLQGNQRMQFMSCSDKICTWNVLGLQGSLLSHFMEPIYLESVIVANLFSFQHLVRALHGRINQCNFESPSFYYLHKTKVAKVSFEGIINQQSSSSPNYAVNWIHGEDDLEDICCDTGKLSDGKTSRLSKKAFFDNFINLLGKNVPTLASCTLNPFSITQMYRNVKNAATDYRRAKIQIILYFLQNELGSWIHVPSEIDLFRCQKIFEICGSHNNINCIDDLREKIETLKKRENDLEKQNNELKVKLDQFITNVTEQDKTIKFNETETLALPHIRNAVLHAFSDCSINNVNQDFKTCISHYTSGKWSLLLKECFKSKNQIPKVRNIDPQSLCSFTFDGQQYVAFKVFTYHGGKRRRRKLNDPTVVTKIEKILQFTKTINETQPLGEGIIFNESETFAPQVIKNHIKNSIIAITRNGKELPNFTIVINKLNEDLPGNWFIQLRNKNKLLRRMINQIIPETFCSFTSRGISYIVFIRQEKDDFQSPILLQLIRQILH